VEAREALIQFLESALAKKRDRICGFASKPKTQRKFFDLLYHSLGQHFSPSTVVSELPEVAWCSPALAFVAPDQFGVQVSSLREAYDQFGEGEGALLISADSRFGIWCDHTYVDDRVFVTLEPNAAA
jgi:hypothetical protein